MEDLVVKHNDVIQASYRLSPNEQAIILTVLSNVSSDEVITDEVLYDLDITSLCQLTGVHPKNGYKAFKDAAYALQDRKVLLKNFDEDSRMNWVQTCTSRKGKIKVRFGKDIIPYLTNLKKNFTSYNLRHVAKFKSTYGVRVYELLKQWHKSKEELEISLEDMKDMFQLGSSYNQMCNLKNKVINPALKDINDHSDLNVSYENIKNGRKIIALKFKFHEKYCHELDPTPNTECSDDLFLSRCLSSYKTWQLVDGSFSGDELKRLISVVSSFANDPDEKCHEIWARLQKQVFITDK